MNKPSEDISVQRGDAVEALLEKAAPRPVPPAEVENEIRAAVYAEWQAVTGTARRRRQVRGFAIAATVVLALAAAFSTLLTPGVVPIEVATIEKSQGSIVLEVDRTGQVPADNLMVLVAGQTLLTAKDSVAGLAWNNGGSLRVDQNSRIELVSDSEIFLHSGRVYFDSAMADPDAEFLIHTTHGTVSHVGTQYMTRTTPASLIVSVREGKVDVEGTFHDQTAYEGQVVELTGSAPAIITNTTGTGRDWEWIEVVAPAVDLSGKSTFDFLMWVGRETGHEIRWASEDAERIARESQFVGEINADPRSELRIWMLTTDLDARFDPAGPAIIVSESR